MTRGLVLGPGRVLGTKLRFVFGRCLQLRYLHLVPGRAAGQGTKRRLTNLRLGVPELKAKATEAAARVPRPPTASPPARVIAQAIAKASAGSSSASAAPMELAPEDRCPPPRVSDSGNRFYEYSPLLEGGPSKERVCLLYSLSMIE
jgi:hypothetical protein